MHKIHFNQVPNLPRKAAVIAITLAFAAPTWADEDEEITRLIKPESSISVGIGHVNKDNQQFGIYNGLSKDGVIGLIDFSIVRRDDETGTWYRALGRNLGLDNRELRLEHERQGAWGYFLEYNEITRHTPYTVQSNVQGIGSNTLNIPKTGSTPPIGASNSYTLKTERQRSSLGLNYALPSNFELRVLFQNEEKQGERLFGRGTGSTQEFLADPINTTTRQFDLVLDYTGEALQLSGGYYGSFFNNSNSFLKVNNGNDAFNSGVGTTGVAMDKIALPPDNHAHQFHLAGGYQLAQTTRMNFKVAKSIAIQNDDFIPVNYYGGSKANANESGRTNLGGRVDTTLVNLGITSRPISNLSLLGNLRYEDRDDKTAIAQYIKTGINASSATNGFNEPRSLTTKAGKFEASYLLPDGYRVTGGYDYEQKNRSTDGVRVVGYREETQESTYRAEVKRAMAETVTGALAYAHSKRDGSDYKNLATLGGYDYPHFSTIDTGCNKPYNTISRCGLIQPIYMADRVRDKIRWMMDWSPTDQFSAQFMVEGTRDNYGAGRGMPDIGTREGESRLYSLDLSYVLSDKWKVNGWLSRTEASIDQSTISAPTNTTGALVTQRLLWSSQQKNIVDSFGVGMRGKLPYAIDIGADYIFSNDQTRYSMRNEGAFGNTAAVSSLPDIHYRQQTLRLFGTHAYDKQTTIRLDYIADKRRTDDWTWTDWTYTDGTKIVQNQNATVQFVGVSVNYKFQ